MAHRDIAKEYSASLGVVNTVKKKKKTGSKVKWEI